MVSARFSIDEQFSSTYYYIASHYGKLQQIDELHYVCSLPIEQYDKIFLLTGYQHDEYTSAHNKEFATILNKHSIIANWPWDAYTTLRLTNNTRNPRIISAMNVFSEVTDKIRAIRNATYSKVIEEGSSSGRWVSEQQLYALIKSLFSDAIYQYRCNWLEAQSLDIFIPSISVGIEYQGQQHYCVIDIFGGEDAFEYRVELDKKKRKRCKENGVSLVEWKYTIPVTKENAVEIMKNG